VDAHHPAQPAARLHHLLRDRRRRPGLSRTLLTTRLRELERAGVVRATPSPNGRGFRYHLTEAGQDLAAVMQALGTWGERWMELAPEHLDPGVVLHSWVSWYLARELLPERRVVAHFRFPGLPRKGGELWVVFDGERSEVCRKDPGFEVELFVEAEPATLAERHLGRIEWVDALRAGRIRVLGPGLPGPGPADLNRRSPAAQARRAATAS
jgi:DNA-binding MarR family transcriptional regulator